MSYKHYIYILSCFTCMYSLYVCNTFTPRSKTQAMLHNWCTTARYITYISHLWFTKIFIPLQQEFTNNNNTISQQQLWNVIIISVFSFCLTIPPGTCKEPEACKAGSHNLHKLNDLNADKIPAQRWLEYQAICRLGMCHRSHTLTGMEFSSLIAVIVLHFWFIMYFWI